MVIQHFRNALFHERAIFRVYKGQIFFYCWRLASRIKTIDPKQLGGPVTESGSVECPAAHMGKALPFSEIKFALLKRLLGAFALRYIDYGAHELAEITEQVEDRMTDDVNVTDPFFRMNDAVVQFEICFVTDGFLEPFPDRRLIVRMNSMKEFFESRQRASRIEPQYAVAHLRPVPDVTSRGVPCPTASLTESLRFRQICFAFT